MTPHFKAFLEDLAGDLAASGDPGLLGIAERVQDETAREAKKLDPERKAIVAFIRKRIATLEAEARTGTLEGVCILGFEDLARDIRKGKHLEVDDEQDPVTT